MKRKAFYTFLALVLAASLGFSMPFTAYSLTTSGVASLLMNSKAGGSADGESPAENINETPSEPQTEPTTPEQTQTPSASAEETGTGPQESTPAPSEEPSGPDESSSNAAEEPTQPTEPTKETPAESEAPAEEPDTTAADPTEDSGEDLTTAEMSTEESGTDPTKSSESRESQPESSKVESTAESIPESSQVESSPVETTPESTEESSTAESSSMETSSMAFLGPIIPADIVIPEFKEDFRFTTVDKRPALLGDQKSVFTEKSNTSPVVGTANGDALVYILETGEEWNFVESGYIRGFVNKADLRTGEEAELEMKKQEKWNSLHLGSGTNPYGYIKPQLGHMSNPAFAYTRTTTMDTLVNKIYALAEKDLQIYDSRVAALDDTIEGNNGKVVGTLEKGGLMYIIVHHGKTVYVESDDVRGFVNTENIRTGRIVSEEVEARGDSKYPLAAEQLPWQENKAVYYTIESVKAPRDPERQAVIQFALQFVGYPYKWGGTNLTGGIDCSGFVQAVYKQFGYSLPRTSGLQRNYGINIESLADALPGDIICYEGHVALYLGNGQIVHASNSKPYPRGGIKVSKVGIRPILAIRRIIK